MTKRKKPKLEPVYILADAEIDALAAEYLLEHEDLRAAVSFESWLRCRRVPAVYDDGAVECVEAGESLRVRVDRIGCCETVAL